MNAHKTVGLLMVWIAAAGIAAESGIPKMAGIEEKLNKEIQVGLKDVLITDALDKLSKEIDMPIMLSDEAEYKLPYGKSTRLSVTLKGPACEGLTQMLNEFFMRYAIGQNEITIYPRPELDHIVGRPSTRQLQLLKTIYTKPIRVYITNNVAATINTALEQEVYVSPIEYHASINAVLRKLAGEKNTQTGSGTSTGQPFYELKLPLNAEGKEEVEYTLATAAIFPQLLRNLKIGNGSYPAEWYIPSMDMPGQTPEIQIVEDSTLSMLKRKQIIDVHFDNKTLLEIFQTLADRGGIYYTKSNDAPLFLNERMTVSMQNVTAMQAMIKIANMAQIRYESDGYRDFKILGKILPAQPQPTPAAATAKPVSSSDDRSQYVGKISIPMDGGKYYIEYMLRENDLTDELKKLRTEKIKEILGSQANEKMPPKAVEKTS